MNYINEGKRDILIFPKFNNINKIQKVREQYDEFETMVNSIVVETIGENEKSIIEFEIDL